MWCNSAEPRATRVPPLGEKLEPLVVRIAPDACERYARLGASRETPLLTRLSLPSRPEMVKGGDASDCIRD